MARLYANENFPKPVVDELRTLGHDVLTIQETGRADQAMSDESVLDYAIAENRAVITLNRKHFIRLHRLVPDHAGIVVCSFDPDFIGQAHRINKALLEHVLLDGRLLRVNRPG